MYLDHPGVAKISLLRDGVAPPERVRDEHGETPHCPRCLAEERYLDLVLPGGVWVAAPVRDGAPIRLERGRTASRLRAGDESIACDVLPQPSICRRTSPSGRPTPSFAVLKGETLVLRPIPSDQPIDLRERYLLRRPAEGPVPIDDVLDAVGAALAEGAPPVVRIDAGFLDPEDAGWTRLEPYVRYLRHHFDLLVLLQWSPPRTDDWIEAAYAAGVDGVSFPLEVFDPVVFERAAPGKARLIGYERYLAAAAAAARVFPRGAVSVPLLVGIEPLDSTADGIEALAADGIVPLLAPLPREALTPFARGAGAGEGEPVVLLDRLFEAARRAGLPFAWTPSQGDLLAPAEGRFRAPATAPLALAVSRWARTPIGRPVHRTLARVRRKLKVVEEG